MDVLDLLILVWEWLQENHGLAQACTPGCRTTAGLFLLYATPSHPQPHMSPSTTGLSP